MPLPLSSPDLERYRKTSEALLSPLEHDDTAAWCGRVMDRVNAFFGSSGGFMAAPEGTGFVSVATDLAPDVCDRFRALLAHPLPGAFRVEGEPQLDEALRVRRAIRMEVWSNAALERAHGVPMARMPFYHEVMVPAKVVHGYGFAIPLPLGEGLLNFAYPRPGLARWTEPTTVQLMEMVLPAFKAGMHLLVRARGWKADLARTVDELGQALLLCDRDGRELHRSRGLKRLLARDPERERVTREMRARAAALVRLRRGPRKTSDPEPGREGQREISTALGRYVARACYLPLQGGSAILVSLESLVPELPSAERLVEGAGLTRREAEIALLLARGRSNREVAERLYISPHTVRTHAEHIFAKLGIRSRKALALALLDGSLPR